MSPEPPSQRVDLAPFEELYRADPDPWNFSTSPYEQHRYDRTIANLPRPRYRRCFEPGCSVGVLTARLAEHADEVLAQDPSATAVAEARRRLAQVANVELRVGAVPELWPTGTFDLIVCSELGYYFSEPALARLGAGLHDALDVGGDLIAVHWLGRSPDHLLGGATVHETLAAVLGDLAAQRLATETDPGRFGERFVIDVWRRTA